MQPNFETFDHTADMGMRIVAPTLTGLVEPATQGLYSLIGELELAPDSESETIILEPNDENDVAFLLRDYLAKLLYNFECHHRIAILLAVQDFTNTRLVVDITWRRIDPDRSTYHREVKAITYHDLAIREIPGGFEAIVIVDI